jgi:hypothetical protein
MPGDLSYRERTDSVERTLGDEAGSETMRRYSRDIGGRQAGPSCCALQDAWYRVRIEARGNVA